MKTHRLLYYPDFHPDTVWLRRVLLVADGVARIVPTDVTLEDPDDLLILQESIPGCLDTISPEKNDIAIDDDILPRLAKTFALLAKSRRRSNRHIKILIDGGSFSFAGHVFLHNAKVSHIVKEELERNGLIIKGFEELTPQGGYLVVDKEASNLILSLIAEKISRRTGLDAITDRPLPFAMTALNNLRLRQTPFMGGVEGTVLSSLTSVLIPREVSTLSAKDYCELREAYTAIRGAFTELTADLARINRLDRIEDPERLESEVELATKEFAKEYEAFRKSKYARGFNRWAPLYVGGLLSIVGTVVAPHVAAGIAGASLVIQVVQKAFDDSEGRNGHERVFNMLTGLRKDIFHRSGVKEII